MVLTRLFSLTTSVYVCGYTDATVCTQRAEDNFHEPLLSFHHVGHGNQIRSSDLEADMWAHRAISLAPKGDIYIYKYPSLSESDTSFIANF